MCREARERFERRTNRYRQPEAPDGQCGFRAVMRQILAKRGIQLDVSMSAVTRRQTFCVDIAADGGESVLWRPLPLFSIFLINFLLPG